MKQFLLLIITFSSYVTFGQIPEPNLDFTDCSFQAIGHRGYSSVYPENTLLAIEEAFIRGIKICEVDVQVTTDDVYVLFHDSYALHRTTNGQGRIDDINYAQTQTLDVGIWKGQHFKNMQMPSLEDALLLAQKYNAQLYLDTKTFNPELLLEAIQNTGVDDNRLMPSLNAPEDIAAYRALLPNSPWVWFEGGLLPDSVSFPSFYTDKVAKNCVAFEVSSFAVESTDWTLFEEYVHAANAKTWVFTENENSTVSNLIPFGVDAIESDRPWEITDFICNNIQRSYPDSVTRGNWRFKTGLNNAVGLGSQLRLTNYENPLPTENPVFGTCSNFGIAALTSANDSVMFVPKQGVDGGLFVYSNSIVESYGIEDEDFTVIMDVLFPAASLNSWISIFQTSTININDAELFINPSNQLGISGEYFGEILPDRWYRIAFTINITAGYFRLYLDGIFLGQIPIESNRWAAVNSSASGERQGFMLFADNDDETQDVYLSALQYRDFEMDSLNIVGLGKASNNGIQLGNIDLWNVSLPNEVVDKVILDYGKHNYHLWLPNPNIGSSEISFETSYKASTNVSSGAVLDWSTGQQQISITAEDGFRTQVWNVVLHQSTVGIAERKEAELFTLFPNPTASSITVKRNSSEQAVFYIYSVDGRLVQQGLLSKQVEILSLNLLQAGNYLFAIQTDKGRFTQKLQKF